MRQASEFSFQPNSGTTNASRPAQRRIPAGFSGQGGREARPLAPAQQWRGRPEPAIAPFGIANDAGSPGTGFRFGSGPVAPARAARSRPALKPIVYVGALGVAVLLAGVSWFAVFADGGARGNGSEQVPELAANIGSGPSGDATGTAVAASTVEPVSVKTVSITPDMLKKGLGEDPAAATGSEEATVKSARWGYSAAETGKARGSAIDNAVKSAYAATGAVAARPWPITAGKVDDAGDPPAEATAEPEKAAPAKEAPAKSEPPAVTIEKVKYRDTVNDHVNMRYGPSSHKGVITVIPKGTTVGVVECNSWCKVDLNGRQGWIYNRYLGNKQAAATQSADNAAQADAAPAAAKPEPDDTSKTQFEKMKESF